MQTFSNTIIVVVMLKLNFTAVMPNGYPSIFLRTNVEGYCKVLLQKISTDIYNLFLKYSKTRWPINANITAIVKLVIVKISLSAHKKPFLYPNPE